MTRPPAQFRIRVRRHVYLGDEPIIPLSSPFAERSWWIEEFVNGRYETYTFAGSEEEARQLVFEVLANRATMDERERLEDLADAAADSDALWRQRLADRLVEHLIEVGAILVSESVVHAIVDYLAEAQMLDVATVLDRLDLRDEWKVEVPC